MPKSPHALAVDRIQAELRPFLADQGFRVRGRTFNRTTQDGLTQVVNIQMGPSDPPGTTYIPWLRPKLHGLFTVNLGVHVSEVHRELFEAPPTSWVREYDCCVRSRLGADPETDQDVWWHARSEPDVVEDVRNLLEKSGIPWLQRFATRDCILHEWKDRAENLGAGHPPRLVLAVILNERGEKDRARAFLAAQAQEADVSGHRSYVHGLAKRLGLWPLESSNAASPS